MGPDISTLEMVVCCFASIKEYQVILQIQKQNTADFIDVSVIKLLHQMVTMVSCFMSVAPLTKTSNWLILRHSIRFPGLSGAVCFLSGREECSW